MNRPSFREIAPQRAALRQFYAEKAKYGKPMKVGRLHHSGFRGMWNDLVSRTSAIADVKVLLVSCFGRSSERISPVSLSTMSAVLQHGQVTATRSFMTLSP